MRIFRYVLICAVGLTSIIALAQWQWTDKDGRRVFSDRAPPADVPEKNILKRPGNQRAPDSRATTAIATVAGASAAQDAASLPKLSGVDKELAAKKKKAEEAQVAKRQEEEERILKARVENCARAKQAKTTLDSGVRMAQFNEKGEPQMMGEAARAAEMQRVQSIISSDCQ
jgi:hypothetical protein